MNYIHRLEMQVRLMADEIVRRENQRHDLICYLHSDKFRQERHVNIADVLVRLGAGFGSTGSYEGDDDQVRVVLSEFADSAKHAPVLQVIEGGDA